ncbi:MAG: hypothetical protein H7A45_17550 [Verrucomicrobiales bacterium]|nr:hypothetical protein [Verrucomicrobiales bacterium]
MIALPVVLAQVEPVHLFTGSGGERPYGSVVMDTDGILYGTTAYGGAGDRGVVYRVKPDGSDFLLLHDFGKAEDGIRVFNSLALAGGAAYGIAWAGGQHNGGTLFRVNTGGGGFQVVHHFGGTSDGGDGAYPYTAPTRVGTALFGMTYGGGTGGWGSVYRYDTVSGDYQVLHSFQAGQGTRPFGTVTAVGDWLYGMASDHLSSTSSGVIFRMRFDGTQYEVVHGFSGGTAGGYPYDSLVYDGAGTLYGTTLGYYTDLADEGVVFSYELAGQQYTVLHDFASADDNGAKPNGGVVISPDGTQLYGLSHGTEVWGGEEFGTLYRLGIDGTDFTVLHTFASGDAGDTPMRTPWLHENVLYGTAAYGGASQLDEVRGYGMVWSVSVPETNASSVLAMAAAGYCLWSRGRAKAHGRQDPRRAAEAGSGVVTCAGHDGGKPQTGS